MGRLETPRRRRVAQQKIGIGQVPRNEEIANDEVSEEVDIEELFTELPRTCPSQAV